MRSRPEPSSSTTILLRASWFLPKGPILFVASSAPALQSPLPQPHPVRLPHARGGGGGTGPGREGLVESTESAVGSLAASIAVGFPLGWGATRSLR